jgi:hypothetical protein
VFAVTEGKQLLRKAKKIVESINQAKQKQERDSQAAGICIVEDDDKVGALSHVFSASHLECFTALRYKQLLSSFDVVCTKFRSTSKTRHGAQALTRSISTVEATKWTLGWKYPHSRLQGQECSGSAQIDKTQYVLQD